MRIKYTKGDACQPIGDGPKIIAHICNDIGGWGRGFVLSLSQQHSNAETAYRSWYHENEDIPFELGQVQFVQSHGEVRVANMIAQHGIFIKDDLPPIRYGALQACLYKVACDALATGASVHMPRIGCGLAGGEWSKVERVIEATLGDKGVSVYVYDFEPGDARQNPWKK